MRIIRPQKITEDADVIATNLVDTRYDEWDDEGAFSRGDRVRISDERSEYEALIDHNNVSSERWLFSVANRLPGTEQIKRIIIGADGRAVDDDETLLSVEPSDVLEGKRIGGIAYEEDTQYVWLAIGNTGTGGATAYPYRISGPNLLRVRGREIPLDGTSSGYGSRVIDIYEGILYAAILGSSPAVERYSISTRSRLTGDIDLQSLSASWSQFCVGNGYLVSITRISSQWGLRAYSLTTRQEDMDLRTPAIEGVDDSATQRITTVNDIFYLHAAGEGLFRGYKAGDTGFERSGDDDLSVVVGTISTALDVSLNISSAIKNPATEQEAVESDIIPDPDPRHWARIGATMPWRLFDGLPRQRSERANSIEMEVKLAGPIDAVAFIGLVDCTSINITVTRSGSTRHDEDYSISTSDVQTAWDHVLGDPIATRLLVDDLPDDLEADDQMEVTFTGGNDLACGQMVFGPALDIGRTELLPRQSKINVFGASKIIEDILGDVSVQRGLEAQTFTMALSMDEISEVDDIVEALYSLQGAERALWIGSTEEGVRGWAYGFYRDYRLTFPKSNQAVLVLTLQELI